MVAVGRKHRRTGGDLTACRMTDKVTPPSAPLPERSAFFLSHPEPIP
jgi:hypothetical protein